MFRPNDGSRALHYMTLLTESAPLRKQMRRTARLRFEDMFTVPAMVESVRSLLLSTIPPTVLIEVDNVVADWDSALLESVGEGVSVRREVAYLLEDCLNDSLDREMIRCNRLDAKFCLGLRPVVGIKAALDAMLARNFTVYLCSTESSSFSPLRWEQLRQWMRRHLKDSWETRLIVGAPSHMIQADIYIDCRPLDTMFPDGHHKNAPWMVRLSLKVLLYPITYVILSHQQLLLDAPYNKKQQSPRLLSWSQWEKVLVPLLKGSHLETGSSSGRFDMGPFQSLLSEDTTAPSTMSGPGPAMKRHVGWQQDPSSQDTVRMVNTKATTVLLSPLSDDTPIESDDAGVISLAGLGLKKSAAFSATFSLVAADEAGAYGEELHIAASFGTQSFSSPMDPEIQIESIKASLNCPESSEALSTIVPTQFPEAEGSSSHENISGQDSVDGSGFMTKLRKVYENWRSAPKTI
jgi:hypothetical protein